MAQPQQGPDQSVWFAGDLADPWVVAIADALALAEAGPVRRFDAPGDLPDLLASGLPAPDLLVVHRALLTRHDAERLARLRASRTPPTRVILCLGPYARYADLERWSPLVDSVLHEAVAAETIAARLSGDGSGLVPAGLRIERRNAPRIAVVSTNAALRQTLAEAVEASGYAATPSRDWGDAPPSGPAVWDVPMLEPTWTQDLGRRTKLGPVVVLLGFADREQVLLARKAGASACLEMPFDLAELALALARTVVAGRPQAQPAHPTPPPPAALGRVARRLAESGPDA